VARRQPSFAGVDQESGAIAMARCVAAGEAAVAVA